MSESINVVVLSGNLTRDPELRQSQGGTAVLSGGLAVNDRVRNGQTGQWEDRPNFVDWKVFGARAEALQRILAKGMRVTLTGRLRWSQWEAQDGSGRRSKLEVVADAVELPPRQGAAPQQACQAPAYAPQAPAYAPQTPPPGQCDPRPQAAVNAAYAGTGYASQAAGVYDEQIPF